MRGAAGERNPVTELHGQHMLTGGIGGGCRQLVGSREEGKPQSMELIFSFWDAYEFSNEICTLLKHP